MSWACINIEPGFPNHPKTVELESIVGIGATAYLLRLWCWAALDCPDGRVTESAGVDFLERRIMGWEGKTGALLTALARTRWIDIENGVITIYKFKERNAHFTRMKHRQQAAANARWEKYRRRKAKAHGQGEV